MGIKRRLERLEGQMPTMADLEQEAMNEAMERVPDWVCFALYDALKRIYGDAFLYGPGGEIDLEEIYPLLTEEEQHASDELVALATATMEEWAS